MKIFDNGGETFDRYTLVFKDGSMFGASENPFHPQGFGQFVGDINYESDLSHLGKEIPKDELPEPVRKYAVQLVEGMFP